jgi:cell division protein FtsN
VGPPAAGLASITNEPAAGQYWQVVATSRPDAEIISEALNKKGFHTLVTPASREGVFRVLVGPFQDAGSQAQARTKLEAAGFKNSIIKRY